MCYAGYQSEVLTVELIENLLSLGKNVFLPRVQGEEMDFYKAGHHGSKTSSNDCLLDVIKPKLCVVTCSCGTDEYTEIVANQFPTQAFIDRISKHTDKVYIPTMGDNEFTGGEEFIDMNGDIVISSTENGIEVICSNNSTLLKDTDWFKAERICPQAWLSE